MKARPSTPPSSRVGGSSRRSRPPGSLDFRAVFEAAPEACLLIAPDAPRFTIAAANDAYLRVTRLQREEIVSHGMFEAFPERPDDPAAVGAANLRASLERVIRTREPDALPVHRYDLTGPDGAREERYWSPLTTPVFDARGALAWLLHRVEDATAVVLLERRRAELDRETEAAHAETRAAEQRASGILERITDAFVAVDTTWRIVRANRTARRLLIPHDGDVELPGRSLWDLPGLEGTRFEREFRRATEVPRAVHFEEFLAPLDAWLEVHAYPSREGLSIYLRDVTARKRGDARLRTLESVVTAAHDAVMVTEPSPLDEPGPRILYVNEGFVRMTGYQPHEVLGRSPRFLQGADTDPAARARMRAALERQVPVRVELVNYKKDGTPFWVDVSLSPVFDENRFLTHWTAVQRDTTERRTAEGVALRLAREEAARALAERSQREIAALHAEIDAERRWLQAVLDHMPLGAILFAPDGRLQFNPRAEQLLGLSLSPEGGSAQYAHEILRPDGTPVPIEELTSSRALHTGETLVGVEYVVVRPDGSRVPVLKSAAPIRDAGGRLIGAVAMFQDVAALKETEEALRRAVRSRDDVLGVVAHDLRNPLNTLVLQLKVMQRQLAHASPALQSAVDTILRQAQRMTRLIQDLLDVARLEAGALSITRGRVAVAPLLDDVLTAQRPIAEDASIELRLDAEAAMPDVWADRDRLLQVFENLVGNAMKFTPKGGAVTVGAAAGEREVTFRVSDTGSGIPAEHLPHVFDRYWQARRTDRRGVGLGLAIVRGIVEAHGGSVRVESRVGEGTTFYFTVPVADGG